MPRCKIEVRRPGRAESNALPEAVSVKIFFNPITSLRALRVKVFIQQKHSNRIIMQIFEIYMRFLQKILSKVVWSHVLMVSQHPAQLCHYLAFYFIRHVRIINFRN